MTALAGGRYELGEVVGYGGMARVRRATDTVLGRTVAVKIFRDDLDEDSAARARQEMQTLAALVHPGLVAVHDAGTSDDGQAYLVMELIEGPNLATFCLDGALDPERTRQIGTEVAAALAYVHDQGVVHRDVKPANILLSASGAKLADFGIARIVDGARHTGTGLTIGTAPYLAPEQVTGSDVGPAGDVYALGLVLLEALTGRREYTGGPVETAMARLHRQPEVPADLPAPWPTLLTAMTARDARLRPTAAQVAADLGGAPALDRTEVQPVHDDPDPTRALPLGQAPRTRVARVVSAQDSDRSRLAVLLRPLGVRLALGGVAALLVVGAVASAGSDAPAGADRTPPQQAPATTPLERHLSELEDAVTR